MHRRSFVLATLALPALACSSSSSSGESQPPSPAAAGPLALVRLAPLLDPSSMPEDVRKECNPEAGLVRYIEQEAREAGFQVTLVDAAEGAAGRVLEVKITSILATGGGAWSGPKQVRCTGILFQDGQTVASFHAQRTSGGGMYGGFKGTCSILDTCIEELGEDITEWLRAPTMDAKLGEL